MSDLLTTDQAAAALGISRRRLRDIVDAGTVTPARLGRSLIWTEGDLAIVRPRLQGRPGAPSGERNPRSRARRANELARTSENAPSSY